VARAVPPNLDECPIRMIFLVVEWSHENSPCMGTAPDAWSSFRSQLGQHGWCTGGECPRKWRPHKRAAVYLRGECNVAVLLRLISSHTPMSLRALLPPTHGLGRQAGRQTWTWTLDMPRWADELAASKGQDPPATASCGLLTADTACAIDEGVKDLVHAV